MIEVHLVVGLEQLESLTLESSDWVGEDDQGFDEEVLNLIGFGEE